MFVWQAHEGAITSLAFAPGSGFVSSGVDGFVRFWEPITGALLQDWKLADPARDHAASNIVRVVADATGQFAAVGLRTEGIRFYDLHTGKSAGEFPLYGVLGMAPAPDGTSLFVVGREREIGQRISRRSTKVYQHGYPPTGVIARSQTEVNFGTLAIRPDCTQLRAGSTRFSWPEGRRLDPIIISTGGSQLAVSWDGEKLFGPSGARLLVSSFDFGVIHQRLKGHTAPITALTATPDGRKLWTASADATVRQWDMTTYHCEKCYGLQIGPLSSVALSADGLTAATGSSLRGSIAMWDLE